MLEWHAVLERVLAKIGTAIKQAEKRVLECDIEDPLRDSHSHNLIAYAVAEQVAALILTEMDKQIALDKGMLPMIQ